MTAIGQVVMVAWPQPFHGALPCDGKLRQSSQFPQLAAIVGNTWGGDATQFGLPDLSQVSPTGLAQQPLYYRVACVGDDPSVAARRLYFGQVIAYLGANVPPNMLPCDGRTLPIDGNEALYSLLDSNYGAYEVTTFALPDLRQHGLSAIDSKIQYLIVTNGIFPSHE